MSSKISHPPGATPHTAAANRPEAGAKARVASRAGTRGRQQDEAHGPSHGGDVGDSRSLEDDERFQGDRREQRAPDAHHAPVLQGGGKGSTRPQGALAVPQHAGNPLTQLQRSSAAVQGRRPEHNHWSRLIAQASPERLAQGQQVLERHEAALRAFAELVPGLKRGR